MYYEQFLQSKQQIKGAVLKKKAFKQNLHTWYIYFIICKDSIKYGIIEKY